MWAAHAEDDRPAAPVRRLAACGNSTEAAAKDSKKSGIGTDIWLKKN